MMTPADILAAVYLCALAGLAVYGLLGIITLALYWRHRRDEREPMPLTETPIVTIQLPLFNERYVVDRLIGAVTALHYPREKLQIQIVDDSTDDTTELAAELVDHYQRRGLDIGLIRRENRTGYKAGALAGALEAARGDFIAVFDADFRPEPDFLQRTIPHFFARPELGVVQARWGHLNQDESALTAAQSLALDKHFVIEQTVRQRAELFPKFNGTAGIWRRECIEDAGGWQSDTMCEDLCLSTRAVLHGWKFQFLPTVVAPAELPRTWRAYRQQQARWAQGSTQCLRKYAVDILRSRESVAARLYALLTMAAYATSILLLVLLLVQVPLLWVDLRFPSWLLVFSIAGVGQPLLFILAQYVAHEDWIHRLRHFPSLLLTAIGLAPTIARAVLQGWGGRGTVFLRTPKVNTKRAARARREYRIPLDPLVFVELGLAGYGALGVFLAIVRNNYGPLLFLLSCTVAFSLSAIASLSDR
jgi:cellulose synthase/poly-beta-1,6-N-acetylglucosamine synthase-like glycosyltransferase